jgi:uncharacterized metal-binding protein YceD (DUF177 family)
MKFSPQQVLLDEPFSLVGKLPATVLELNDPAIKATSDISVNLLVNRVEENFLVTGELQTVLKLLCGRCADWMDWPIHVKDFTVDLEAPHPSSIDLTSFIREDILLQLPFNAVCRLDKDYRCPFSGKHYPPDTKPPTAIIGKEVWNALDKLKIKE